MAGGLLQLVAYGAQDQLLTGNPVITFFKAIYRHHTNFAMESIRQTFNGTVGPGKRVVCNVSRHGDLIADCWLEITNPSGNLDKCMIPRIIDSIELEIGGQRIDYHPGDWILKWMNLSTSKERLETLYPTTQKVIHDEMGTTGVDSDDVMIYTNTRSSNTLYVPLQFFFCRNPGLALPLIALQYHEVKINIHFKPSTIYGDAYFPNNTDVNLYVNYIYLDVDERRRFATTSHQMLIEQVQYHEEFIKDTGEMNKKISLNFNHPVKEIIIGTDAQYQEDIPVLQVVSSGSGSMHPTDDGRSGGYNTVTAVFEKKYKFLDFSYNKMRIMLNGQERFSARDREYFKRIQPYMYHTCGNLEETPLHVYSFCLHPEEHQPSGTCNFSRIDNSTIEFNGEVKITSTDIFGSEKNTTGFNGGANLIIYAVNYNILRITSGMGGLAFSN